jgi:high frequency lysogenization protein
MARTLKDRTLSLAGVFQAGTLVQATARFGNADIAALETSLQSVLIIDADDVEQVFGGIAGVSTGLHALIERLGNSTKTRDLEVTRYFIAMTHLERKFVRDSRMIKRVRDGIASITARPEPATVRNGTLASVLAELYQDTISNLKPRIIVRGEPALLADRIIASQVRALLFAGIRAVVLWRQSGGGRLQLLFTRKQIISEAHRLLCESRG